MPNSGGQLSDHPTLMTPSTDADVLQQAFLAALRAQTDQIAVLARSVDKMTDLIQSVDRSVIRLEAQNLPEKISGLEARLSKFDEAVDNKMAERDIHYGRLFDEARDHRHRLDLAINGITSRLMPLWAIGAALVSTAVAWAFNRVAGGN